jgi:hypothetical protein
MGDDDGYHPHETILSEAALETLAPFGEERRVGRGEVVYRAGEAPTTTCRRAPVVP